LSSSFLLAVAVADLVQGKPPEQLEPAAVPAPAERYIRVASMPLTLVQARLSSSGLVVLEVHR
jgi:hypothetical protein